MADDTKVLLVDDESRNLDALEAILEGSDYTVLRATSGDDALRILLAHEVAAIVLDVQMPDLNGLDLARLIKGTKKHRETPILFLTAQSLDEENVMAGYDVGAVEYLLKPVNPRILRQKVAVFVELFRKTRALSELNEHLELRVKERTDALLEAAAQKDRFLATLAHELRNPLAPLRIGLDLVLREAAHIPTATHALTIMNRQLTHMVRLIDDLMDVARISHGTLELRRQPADLGEVIEQAVETAKPVADGRQQSLVVQLEKGLWANVDSARIAQIVTNLISNAAKHSPKGASVRVELERQPSAVLIRVVDRGVGIPGDQLEHIFGMFVKIERQLVTNDGLGLGLALSRHLAELHGGTLDASSAGEGLGATFTLHLPLVPNPEAARDAEQTRPATATVEPQRIVIIEDGEDTLALLARWLERDGHDVHVARNGTDGLALILAQRPDLVLCDLGLPDIDGAEVCRKALAALHTPPIMVALTGWSSDADRSRTRAAGFHLHLVKPVAMEQLTQVLLESRRLLREQDAGSGQEGQ